MDRGLYVAMTGASHIVRQQATNANNMANVNTDGFRQQIDMFRAVPIRGDGWPTRTMVVDSTPKFDLRSGPAVHTENTFDVAIREKGWFAIQLEDGSEAYTRKGNFTVNANGILQTHDGKNVLGAGGEPIAVPPYTRVTIGEDGTISTVEEQNQTAAEVNIVGRLKLVNIEPANLIKSGDALFKTKDRTVPEADLTVRVVQGYVEGSNVNPAEILVEMINLGRMFEMQMKSISTADEKAQRATQLLTRQ